MSIVSSQFTSFQNLGASSIDGIKTVIDPGNTQDLIDFTVPVGKVRSIYKVQIESRIEGSFEIYKGIEMIGSGKTGPASPNVPYFFPPSYPLAAGEQFIVEFTSRAGAPSNVDVAAWVHFNETDE